MRVEGYLLLSTHWINAALHALGRLRIDKDIRHNKMYGALLRENYFEMETMRMAGLFNELEQMRPGQAYGRGDDGAAARRAREIYEVIKGFCGGVLNAR